jgi:uncharacterized membrane protein
VSDKEPADRQRKLSLRTSRMEAFSDGVFAIAITLLVLDLVVPEATERHVGGVLLRQWPIYLAYVVSFASIGAAWLAHSAITEYLDRADSILLRLNLLLLFFVAALPFPTHMLANFLHNANAERIGVTIYGINLLAISAFTSVLWHYAVSEHLVRQGAEDDDVRALTSKTAPSLGAYAIAIGVGPPPPTGRGSALPRHRPVRHDPVPGHRPVVAAPQESLNDGRPLLNQLRRTRRIKRATPRNDDTVFPGSASGATFRTTMCSNPTPP